MVDIYVEYSKCDEYQDTTISTHIELQSIITVQPPNICSALPVQNHPCLPELI